MAQSNDISNFLIKKYQTISEKYELLKDIDQGAFGVVMLARDVISNDKKAIKIMRLMDNDGGENVDKKYIKKLLNEAEVMSKLDHPNILKFDECFQHGIYFCIVSEYCEENLTKVLQRHIREKSRPSDELIYEWLYKLSKGLEYLHDKKIIHRDIKPLNILFKSSQIKIADFGESKNRMLTITKTLAQHGTPHYMAPEVIRGEEHTYKSDVWSLGCVFHEIYYLELAFDGNDRQELENNVMNRKLKNFNTEGLKINDLINNMICIDQTKRISIKEVLSHEYFRENKKEKDDEVQQNKIIDVPNIIELCKNINIDYQNLEKIIKNSLPNLNYKNETGETALMMVSSKGNRDVVELLIKNNANINEKDNNGWTALMMASENGHTNVVELLIVNKANVNEKNNYGWTALMRASSKNHKDVAEILIKNNAKVDEKDNGGMTALMMASIYGHKDVVELLIKNKANLDEKDNGGMTALITASIYGHKDVVELLIANKANINEKNNGDMTALMMASSKGIRNIVEVLINNKANVNIKDNCGRPSLIHASIWGKIDIVELLIKNEANVNEEDSDGRTAVMWASKQGQKDVVEFLIKKNANVNKKDNINWTAVMLASENGHKDVVELLIANKANINEKNKFGMTSIMMASKKGHMDVVELLIKNNADLDEKDNEGLTACLHASKSGHKNCVDLFTSYKIKNQY